MLAMLAMLALLPLLLQHTFTQATTTFEEGIVPIPTPDQFSFSRYYMEMGALISCNLATAAHTQGCAWNKPPPAASIFTTQLPAKINTDQWCAAISSFGGKYATLVAKHLCGFTLRPSIQYIIFIIIHVCIPSMYDNIWYKLKMCTFYCT
jgi:hypothetical protein